FLRADGTVVPDGWYAENGVPAGLTNIIGVAAGGDHSMVLRNDGRIICWGKDEYGQTNVPVGLSNVVAVAAGYYHNLALKANGTVVAWGDNTFGQTNVPAGLSNVVMISAGYSHNLALRSDGSIVGWGTNDYGQISIPPTATNVIAMVAGGSHSMVLRADGTMVAWGFNGDGISSMPASLTNVVAIAPGLALGNDGVVTGWGGAFYGHNPPENESSLVAISCGRSYNLGLRADGTVAMWSGTHSDQTNVPAGLSNVIAIAAGDSHNLALRRDGTVVAWGGNYYGITNVPASATNVVSIAAGTSHCLALRKDGKVVAWGYNYFGQTNVPTGLSNVVMIAAGSSHSLALRADCTVVAWGDGSGGGQPPASVTNVIAIAAGGLHNAALRSDGSVVCWGHSYYGANVAPADATNVVAIAAGGDHCIALRADGSLIAWGKGFHGQTIIPRGATNVFAIAGGIDDHSLFLSASGNGTQPASDNTFAVRTQIPNQVGHLFQTINRSVLTNLNFDLHGVATEVSGSKALLTAVLELGLPYTLERDDVLRGFLYGSESLAGLEEARGFLQSENARLDAAPGSAPQTLMDISMLRYLRFGERLEQRLNDLAATGQPEIPRLVGHTLRLLNLLRDSWNTTPPSALEIDRGTNAPGIVLYGEPYAHYALQYSDALGVPAWVSGSGTNVHNEQRIVLPVPSGQQRFYRAVLPIP
ncbi:MAG TPA: hypothetical protein VK327_15440, partial [Candidatus Paceibacterota bacterium]|nr:hypothetical protein [Candidatus Paceibacterota bacterium]